MSLGQNQKEAWGAVLLAHAALTRVIDKQLAAAGCVSLQVYDVLLALEDSPGRRMRMTDLSEAVVFDPSSLTRLIDRLEKQGLVRRELHPTDRRCVLAVLTDEGLAAREQAWPIYRELIHATFGQFLTDSCAKQMSKSIFKALHTMGAPVAKRIVSSKAASAQTDE